MNSCLYARSHEENLITDLSHFGSGHSIHSIFNTFKQNHYVPEDDLHTATRIWNDDIKLDTLTQSILSTDFSIFEKYDFMSISYYH